MADDDKPKLLKFGTAYPEMRRLDKPALDQARGGEEQLESEREDDEEAGNDHVPKGLAIFILVLLGALVATAIHFVTKQKPEKLAPTLASEKVSSLLTNKERRELITKNLEAYCASKTNEERLALVINPEEVRERLVRYYNEKKDSLFSSPKIQGMRFVLLDSQPWAWATVTFRQRGGHVVALQEIENDYKIDWDCLVGYGELSWEELREARPKEPVQMRAFIQLSDYYNYHYSDPKAYAVYALRGYETAPTIYGYVERDSEIHKELQKVVAPGTIRAINLKLHYDPKSDQGDQAVIDEILHILWTDPELINAEQHE